MPNHTPAPWRIKRVASSKIHAVVIIGGDDFSTVATLRDVYENEPFFKEGAANAHLIAAAPELADMLDDLLTLMESGNRQDVIEQKIRQYGLKARLVLAR